MPVKKPKAEEEVITEAVVAEEPVKPILEAQVVEEVAKEDVVPPPVTPPTSEPVAAASELVKKENGGWRWMLVAFVLGAVVGTVSGYLVAKTQKSNVKTQNSTTAQASPTPSPSPAADIKRADLKVQVLNGSGVAGAAAKAKAFLEGLGYVNVTAGNADGDFAETEVDVKADKISAKEMIVGDLEDEYTLAETVGELDADSDYDVVITLGAE